MKAPRSSFAPEWGGEFRSHFGGIFCCPPALVIVEQPLNYPWKLESSGHESVCFMVWQVQTDQYIPEEDIYGEMDAIEHQLDELEHRGVALEEKLRSAENGVCVGLSVGVGRTDLRAALSPAKEIATVTFSLLMLGLEEHKRLCWLLRLVTTLP